METVKGNQPNQSVQTAQQTQQALTPSARFTNEVLKQFGSTTGDTVALTDFQRKLIRQYFIALDTVLQNCEIKRLKKTEQYRDPLAYIWANVNLTKLSLDVVNYSSVGLDPSQKNNISLIPNKNNKTNKYDVDFRIGYIGKGIVANKYGTSDKTPDNVVVEIVYSTDVFQAIKKDRENKVEGYKFTITQPFDRGKVVGGFYYHEYFKEPVKNVLEIYSKADIDKRKPKSAAAEFWGGEKDVWENGHKVGTETVEGWYDEMAYKTVYLAAYSVIPIDSEKIDMHYTAIMEQQQTRFEENVQAEIKANANKEAIGFPEQPDEQYTEAEVMPEPQEKTTDEVEKAF